MSTNLKQGDKVTVKSKLEGRGSKYNATAGAKGIVHRAGTLRGNNIAVLFDEHYNEASKNGAYWYTSKELKLTKTIDEVICVDNGSLKGLEVGGLNINITLEEELDCTGLVKTNKAKPTKHIAEELRDPEYKPIYCKGMRHVSGCYLEALDVYFNEKKRITTIKWSDDTITIVTDTSGAELFDKDLGIINCIAKKALGSTTGVLRMIETFNPVKVSKAIQVLDDIVVKANKLSDVLSNAFGTAFGNTIAGKALSRTVNKKPDITGGAFDINVDDTATNKVATNRADYHDFRDAEPLEPVQGYIHSILGTEHYKKFCAINVKAVDLSTPVVPEDVAAMIYEAGLESGKELLKVATEEGNEVSDYAFIDGKWQVAADAANEPKIVREITFGEIKDGGPTTGQLTGRSRTMNISEQPMNSLKIDKKDGMVSSNSKVQF